MSSSRSFDLTKERKFEEHLLSKACLEGLNRDERFDPNEPSLITVSFDDCVPSVHAAGTSFAAPRSDPEPALPPLPEAFGPAIAALRLLISEQIVDKLRSESEYDTFFSSVEAVLPTYIDLARALSSVVRSASGPADRESRTRGQRRGVEMAARATAKFAGDDAADEVRFAGSTYVNAVSVAARLTLIEKPTDLENDARLALAFRVSVALHGIGVHLLKAMCMGKVFSDVARESTFHLLRFGALRAYACAREAQDLRASTGDSGNTPPEHAMSALDYRLADAKSI